MRLAFLLLTLLPLHAQDSRNTDIPHTDTRFAPRTDATLGDWKTRRAHLQKQVLSAAGLLPYPKNLATAGVVRFVGNLQIINGLLPS